MLGDLWIRLRSLFRRKAVEAELEDELRFHLERQTEKRYYFAPPRRSGGENQAHASAWRGVGESKSLFGKGEAASGNGEGEGSHGPAMDAV